MPVRPPVATPSPYGAPLPTTGVQLSNHEKLAAAVGTGDFEMVDQAKLTVVVGSLVEATEAKIAQLGQQYDGVLRRLEACDASEYDEWEARADKVLAQQSLEQGWLSYLLVPVCQRRTGRRRRTRR